MKKLLYLLALTIFVLSFHAPQVQAAYECPEGFYWSRETVACEQETCPSNSHRNYTLECICDEGYGESEHGPTGLLLSCSKRKISTNSASATPSTGGPADLTSNTNQSAPEVIPPTLQSAERFFDPYLVYVPTELKNQFTKLMEQYNDEIPIGVYGYENPEFPYNLFNPGQLNNLTYGENETACGAYQDLVLKWLLSLKFSDNTEARALINKFDFGPIQITKGAHQAVVIFPKGSDWRVTGIVLDPWVEQRPRIYTIQEWDNMFFLSPEGSVGNILTPIKSNIGKFPTTPDENGNFEYDDVYSSKPRTSNRLRQDKGKQLLVQSPVAVLIQSQDNKSIGINNKGKFVNDFGLDVEAPILLKGSGDYRYVFNLPDGEYSIKLTGTGTGEVQVYSSTGNNDIFAFDKVMVGKDNKLTIEWKKANTKPTYTDQQGKTIGSKPLSELKQTDTTKEAKKTPSTYSLIGASIIVILLIAGLLFAKRRGGKT